jgi:TrmH family RNA methyltransferase
MTITSLQNARVKAAAKLRERRGRETQQRIIIDGAREILRAAQAGVQFVELFMCPDSCQSDDIKTVLAKLKNTNAEVIDVSPSVLEKLSFGERNEGIVATAHPPHRELDDIQLEDDSLVAVIEQIEKPGNLGAILRTADAAGVSAVVAADPVADLFNPNVIRASLGAVFTVPTVESTAQETITWLRANQVTTYAARVEGSLSYTDVDYRGRVAIVLGSEAKGLSDQWPPDEITSISLPMLGVVDSLNVSATAAVLFYEANRQRRIGYC